MVVDPCEVQTDVNQELSEGELLKRAYWQWLSLKHLMFKRTDYAYEKEFRKALVKYLQGVEERLFILGERL